MINMFQNNKIISYIFSLLSFLK